MSGNTSAEIYSESNLPGASRIRRETNRVVLNPERIFRRFFVLGMVLAAVILFAHRHTMNADGLSYMEVGESWLKGDFSNAINGYWNPVYPILVALSMKLMPAGASDPAGPHCLNFFIFVFAWFAFRHFARTLARTALPEDDGASATVLYTAGSAAFLWAALRFNPIVEITPDLLMGSFLLLAAAALLRLPQAGWRGSLVFGALLGFGYLIKSVMFPLGLVFLTASVFVARPVRRGILFAGIAAVAFLAVASVYIIPLSLQKGRLTTGDSGALAYAWEVNNFGPYFHWHGQPPGSGVPKHPTRQILDYPPVYEFDGTQPGTYPLFRDPSYWNEGMHPKFRLGDQLKRLWKSAKFYRDNVVREPILVMFFFSLLLGCVSVGWRNYARESRRELPLIAAALMPFVLYAAVYIDSRYLAIFTVIIVLCGISVFLRARRGALAAELSWAKTAAAFILVLLLSSTVLTTAKASEPGRWNSYDTHAKIAAALEKAGVKPGAKLAVIGRGNESYFARIMHSRIVAECLVFPGHREWAASVQNLEKVAECMQNSTSAAAIVCMLSPIDGIPEGWTHVPGTDAWVMRLQRSRNGI